MKRIITILFILNIPVFSCAQDFVSDIKKMYDTYKNTENMSFDVVFNIYKKGNDLKPEVQKGIVKKAGSLYYVKFYDNEMVVGKKYTVMVDYAEKEVYAFLSVKDFKAGLNAFKMPDSAAYINKAVDYKGVVNGSKKYVVKNSSQEVSAIEMYLDVKNYFITKLVYVYNQAYTHTDFGAVKVVADYLNVNMTTPPSLNSFDVDRFIAVKDGRILLGKGYAGYKLIDLTKKEADAKIR